MHRRRFVAFALLVCTLLIPDLAGGQGTKPPKVSLEWRRVRTDNFEAVSNAPLDDVRKVLGQLEVFRTNLVTRFLRLRTSAPVSTLVVILKDFNSFTRFQPRDDRGRRGENVGAYFTARPERNYVVVPAGQALNLTAVFHEYYHFVAVRNTPLMPFWVSEGLAEYYSTAEIEPAKGQSVIGKVIPNHVDLLRIVPLAPVAQLVTDEGAARIANGESWKIRLLYAESWALVHYLMVRGGSWRASQFDAYLDAIERAVPPEQAFQSAFGLTYAEADKALAAYVKRPTYAAVTLNQQASDVSSASSAWALTEAEAQYVQGNVLRVAHAYEDAEKLLTKAISLDAANVAAKVALADVRVAQDRAEEAVAALKPIVNAEPENFPALLTLGSACMKTERYDEALRGFSRAAAVNDQVAAVWSGVSDAALALGRIEESDRAMGRLQDLEPDAARYYRRAFQAFDFGHFTTAASDARLYITKAGRWASSSPYLAFVGAIALWRLERPTEAEALLAEVRPEIPSGSWTLKVMDFMQGRLEAEPFLAAAKNTDQRTEAHAYVGFKALQAGRREEALVHLKWAKERGSRTFVEHRMAVAELKRLEKP